MLPFHLGVVCLNAYALWYDQMFVELPFPSKKFEVMPCKARAMFLTFWCLVLQTLYFSIALLNDIVGTNAAFPKRAPFIRKIKDHTFSLAFPVALYVSLAFWGIYAVDRDLIFPTTLDKIVPNWLNQTMHSLIVPFIVIELLLTHRNYPTRRAGTIITLTFNMAYTLWLHILYFKTDIWAYPFLEYLNWPLRILFCISSSLVGYGVYVLGEKLNYMVSSRKHVHTNGVNGTTKKKH